MRDVTIPRWLLAIILVFVTAHAMAASTRHGFADIRDFIGVFAEEGMDSPRLTQRLTERGMVFGPGDAYGRQRGNDVTFADGAVLRDIRYVPDTSSRVGMFDAMLAETQCVPAGELVAAYHLNEVPALIGAPAPSSHPSPDPMPTARRFDGRVGNAQISIMYFTGRGQPASQDCVSTLIVR
ncbi:hypothetical protein KPL74_18430 [Bacillus sp. NP157]|nr:hypothetical protein KPL74_18430 [Bacillus sp. NP157]